jgi:hypothetical protein
MTSTRTLRFECLTGADIRGYRRHAAAGFPCQQISQISAHVHMETWFKYIQQNPHRILQPSWFGFARLWVRRQVTGAGRTVQISVEMVGAQVGKEPAVPPGPGQLDPDLHAGIVCSGAVGQECRGQVDAV